MYYIKMYYIKMYYIKMYYIKIVVQLAIVIYKELLYGCSSLSTTI